MRIMKPAIAIAVAAPFLAGCGLVGGKNAADSNSSANIAEDNGADGGNVDDGVSNNMSVDSSGGDTMDASNATRVPSNETDEQSSSGVVLKSGPSKN